MVRKISMSQFKSQMRQLQQKQKRAVNDYNREVRKYNQKVKQAVNQTNREINRYNSAARTHNSRVRANRDRLKRELQKLASHQNSGRYIEYRTTVSSVQSSYQRLENHADTGSLSTGYDEILDLSEREAANNAEVMNALFGDTENAEVTEDQATDSWLLDFLRKISTDLVDRWRGALFSLNPSNPDAARHFCTSAREVITQILEIKAPDAEVFSLLPNCDKTDRGNPTRRAKIRYFLHRKGLADDHLEEFIERDMEGVVQLFRLFNDGTHGSAGTFNHSQLVAIRKRVEDGISFLSRIISPRFNSETQHLFADGI